jgi:hypothetical protein
MIGVLEAEPDVKVFNFVKNTNTNIQEGGLVKSPFTGELRLYNYYDYNKKNIIIYDVNCIYPNIGRYIILGLCAVVYMFQLSNWLLLISIPFFMMEFFNSNTFFCWVMIKGLRKTGYDKTITRIKKPGKLLIEMIDNVPRRSI